VSKQGIDFSITTDGLEYDSRLDCVQLRKYDGEPLRIKVNFSAGVGVHELERVYVTHRGDPHPDTVPFLSGAVGAHSRNTSSFEEVKAAQTPIKNYDTVFSRVRPIHVPEQPLCEQFSFERGVANIPNEFDMLDRRLARDILSRPGASGDYPIAVFVHNYELREDEASTGIPGADRHTAEVRMNWQKSPPLSPFALMTLPDLLALNTFMQVKSQELGGGYVFGRDWYDDFEIALGGDDEVQTFLRFMTFDGVDGQCSISMAQLAETLVTLEAIRDLIGEDELAKIPGLPGELGATKEYLINFERHLRYMLERLSVFIDVNVAEYPRVVSFLEKLLVEPDLLANPPYSTSPFSMHCDAKGKVSPFGCLSATSWQKLFGVNAANGMHPTVHELVHSLSSTWEPILCRAFPNSSMGEDCLSISQMTCARRTAELRRKNVMGLQNHNPSCKLWKPIEKTVPETIVSGEVSSGGEFRIRFDQIRIKDREARHSTNGIIIEDVDKFSDRFDTRTISGSAVTTDALVTGIKATVKTRVGSLSPNRGHEQLADKFYLLQCAAGYEHDDYRELRHTDNPYERACELTINNFDERGARGCTPFDLASQRNFVAIPIDSVRDGAFGTDCGSMNFNTGELGGSFLRHLADRFGAENIFESLFDPDTGLDESVIRRHLTSNHGCAPGLSCAKTTPCRMYADMIEWGERTDGFPGFVREAFLKESKSALEALPEEECYYGEHGGKNSGLPVITFEQPFTYHALTRSTYRPYTFVEPENDGEATGGFRNPVNPNFDPAAIEDGTLSEKLLRDYILALTMTKGHCGTGTTNSYPTTLAVISNPFEGSLFHPSVWIYTTDEHFVDAPESGGNSLLRKLRHRRHGSNLPSSLFNFSASPSPSPSVSPSPSPSPSHSPSPGPSPVPTPTPTPTPAGVAEVAQSLHRHSVFFDDRLLTSGMYETPAVSFEIDLVLPLPRVTRDWIIDPSLGDLAKTSALAQAKTTACIYVDPPVSVWEAYPFVRQAVELPIVGTAGYDNSWSSDGVSERMNIDLTCLPTDETQVCFDIDRDGISLHDSCFDRVSHDVSQFKTPRDYIHSTLIKAKNEVGADVAGHFGELLESTAHGFFSKARTIRLSWTKQQHPDDIYRFVIPFARTYTAPNGTTTDRFSFPEITMPIYHATLSLGEDAHSCRRRVPHTESYTITNSVAYHFYYPYTFPFSYTQSIYHTSDPHSHESNQHDSRKRYRFEWGRQMCR
jgi:hypothetical protein